MRRILLRVLIGLSLVVAAIVVAGAGVLYFVDVDDHRADIESILSSRLGMDVRLGGPLSLAFGLHPAIVARAVSVSNPDPKWPEPVAQIGLLALEFDLPKAIFARKFELDEVGLHDVKLDFRRTAGEAGNWALPQSPPAESLEMGRGDVSFMVHRLKSTNVEARYQDMATGFELTAVLGSLEVVGAPGSAWIELSGEGQIVGEPFHLEGHIVSPRRLPKSAAGASDEYTLDIELKMPDLDLELRGQFLDSHGSPDLDLELRAVVPSLERASEAFGLTVDAKLDGMGPLELEARLIGGSGAVRLEAIDLKVQTGHGDRARATGSIGDLFAQEAIDLALEIDSPKLERLLRRVYSEPPRLGGATARARVTGGLGHLVFDRIEATVRHESNVELEVTGSVAGLEASPNSLLVAKLRADDVGALIELVRDLQRDASGEAPESVTGLELEGNAAVRALGPVSLTAELLANGDELALRKIDLNLGTKGADWLHATGEIGTLIPEVSDVRLDVAFGSEDLHGLTERIGVMALNLDRVRGNGVLYDHDGVIGLRGLEVVARRDERVTVGVGVSVDDVRALRRAELRVSASAVDLRSLGEVLNRTLPPIGPVKLAAVVVPRATGLSAHGVQIELGESDLEGDVSITNRPSSRPHVVAHIRSASLKVSDLGIDPERIGQSRGRNDSSEPSEELPFDELLTFDGDLSLSVGRLWGEAGFAVEDLSLTVQLEEGVLASDDLDMRWQGGSIHVNTRIDAGAEPPEGSLELHVKGINIEQILAQFFEEGVATGVLELHVDLSARGRTPSELVAGLAGEAMFYARDGELLRRYSEALQLDIGHEFDPGSHRGRFEVVNCIVVDSTIDKGRADLQALLLDTDEKQVLGSGYVDLSRWTLELILTPALKDPIPGSVAVAVRVSGSLDDPVAFIQPFATATAATQGLIERALIPVRKFAPVIGRAYDSASRRAGAAASKAGIDVPETLWRAGIDLTCESVLNTAQIRAVRAWPEEQVTDSEAPQGPAKK